MSTEPQSMAKRNTLAITGLILGVLSIVLAPFYYGPGIMFYSRCVSLAAGLLAIIASALGLRAARNINGQGHKTAIAGIAIGGVSLLVVIGMFTFSLVHMTRQLETVSANIQENIDQELLQSTLASQISTVSANIQEALMPQSFKGGGIQLAYPDGWQKVDISQLLDYCKQPGVECLFAIRHTSGDHTNINLMRLTLQRKASVEEIDLEAWKAYESSTPDVSLESREIIEIGGQSAIRRIFTAPVQSFTGGRGYIMQVYIVKELSLYEITSAAPNAEVFKQHRTEIDEIIASINFTP